MKTIIQIAAILIALLAAKYSYASYHSEIDLQGYWKFSIGDKEEWANPNFDDRDWEEMKVPGRWEENGYQGYNGFAWYRTNCKIPQSFEERSIYLELGFIDDVDEVYFNGVKIGQSGNFPPHFTTAYNSFRKYIVPTKLIRFDGENCIAIRTYDAQLEGGIVRGKVRLAAGEINIQPDIDMSGIWNFKTPYHSNGEEQILVPGQWENQGYFNYDGLATYSREVQISWELAEQKLVFMAGRIDDDDEFYVNGQFIARTGDINLNYNTNMYLEYRNYFIPEGVIKPGKNLVEIKVRDRGGDGGILEGSIGFITQDNFIKYWRLKRNYR